MNKLKVLSAFVLAGLLTAGAGVGVSLVSAQTDTQTDNPSTQTAQPDTDNAPLNDAGYDGPFDAHGFGGRGFGGPDFGRHGFGGHGFGGPALGTSVTYTFYDGDPAADGAVTDTLSFTYGEDSEAAFAETLSAARTDATFAVIQTSEQTRTLDLSSVDTNEANKWRGRGLGFVGPWLNDGSTVSVTFYDGDPEANAQTLETLSFTYGQDSEAGFAAEIEAALENAAFVTVTTSPQERTIDLSQALARDADRNGFGPGRGGSGRDGSNHGGPGRGGWDRGNR